MKYLTLLLLFISSFALGQSAPIDLDKLAQVQEATTWVETAADWAVFLAELLGALTVAATILARRTKSTKDDEYVSTFSKYYLKLLGYMPTMGLNPKTKRMEEELKALKAEKTKSEESKSE